MKHEVFLPGLDLQRAPIELVAAWQWWCQLQIPRAGPENHRRPSKTPPRTIQNLQKHSKTMKKPAKRQPETMPRQGPHPAARPAHPLARGRPTALGPAHGARRPALPHRPRPYGAVPPRLPPRPGDGRACGGPRRRAAAAAGGRRAARGGLGARRRGLRPRAEKAVGACAAAVMGPKWRRCVALALLASTSRRQPRFGGL